MNYKQLYARKKADEERVLKLCDAPHASGIYIFYRVSEQGFRFAYIGQAKDLLSRLAQHLQGYTQHIDLSIKKHGLYSEKNPNGYKIEIRERCGCELLDQREQEWIKTYAEDGWQLLNNTTGSQGGGKRALDIGKSGKGYRQGVKEGYDRAIKEIAVFFEKYLDYAVKGKTTKIKERKLEEFKEMMDNAKRVTKTKIGDD